MSGTQQLQKPSKDRRVALKAGELAGNKRQRLTRPGEDCGTSYAFELCIPLARKSSRTEPRHRWAVNVAGSFERLVRGLTIKA